MFFWICSKLTIKKLGLNDRILQKEIRMTWQNSPKVPLETKGFLAFSELTGIEHPSKHLYWWRHHEDIFCLRLEVLIKTNIFPLVIRLQNTSSRCVDQNKYIRLSHSLSKLLQEFIITSSKSVLKMFLRCHQDVFKTYY